MSSSKRASVPAEIRGSATVRVLALACGWFLCAVGVALMFESGLGVGTWAALAGGLSAHVGLSIGAGFIGLGIAAVLVAWALGVRPGLATVVDVMLFGTILDLVLRLSVVGEIANLTLEVRTAAMLAGLACLGLGTALYLSSCFGAGPRDALMVAVWRRTSGSIALPRLALELSILATALVLSGPIGVGTLLMAVLIGHLVHGSFVALERLRVATTPDAA